MGYQRSVQALLDYWDEVAPQLSADTLSYLVELLGRLGEAGPDAADEVVESIGRTLDQVLPHDDHPVRQALDIDERRGGRVTRGGITIEDLPELATELLRRPGSLDLPTAESPSAAEVTFWVSRWLLAEVALTEDDMADRGLDRADPDLIRLERDDGGEQWPAFQFGPDGAPLSLVKIVNRMLDADIDPWGVADWWLGHNQWLDGVPARLIGQVTDSDLIDAARAVDPGV
jgi:hypothetical protein